jgi:hypothetical protein
MSSRMANPTRSPRHAQTLAAQAFRDAVRDILAVDGVFSLADEAAPDTVYHFDGLIWRKERLPRRQRTRRRVGIAAVQPPQLPS